MRDPVQNTVWLKTVEKKTDIAKKGLKTDTVKKPVLPF